MEMGPESPPDRALWKWQRKPLKARSKRETCSIRVNTAPRLKIIGKMAVKSPMKKTAFHRTAVTFSSL